MCQYKVARMWGRTLCSLHTQTSVSLLPLGWGGVCLRIRSCCSAIGGGSLLRSLVLQRDLEHADLPLQLLIDSLSMSAFPFLLCDLGLHFGALNVPCVAGSLVVVPFDLEEAHDACKRLSVNCPPILGPHGRAERGYVAKAHLEACTLRLAGHGARFLQQDRLG